MSSNKSDLKQRKTHQQLYEEILKDKKIILPDRSATFRMNDPRRRRIRSSKSTYNEAEQAIKNNIHYWKHVKDKQIALESKSKSATFRRNLLESQKRINYQNEYDRLRAELAQTILPQSKRVIEARLEQLKNFNLFD